VKKLNVGFVGLGKVAESHLEGYKEIDQVQVIAGTEVNPERLKYMTQRWGFRGYSDYREMLAKEKLDIACILTPPILHREITETVAERGIHILCEKPMAVTLDDARTMISAYEKAGIKFYYGSSFRCLPACAKAKEMIEHGDIGDVCLMMETYVGGGGPENWHDLGPHHYTPGGPGGGGMGIVDHGIHTADAFQWLSGSDVEHVFGRGNYSGKAPSTEYLTMLFKNGAIGQLIYNEATFPTMTPYEGMFSLGASWSVSGDLLPPGNWDPQPGSLHIHGDKGALRIFHYANRLFFIGADRQQEVLLLGKSNPGHFGTQIRSFANSILRDEAPAVTGQDGLRALRVILAAYESQKKKALVSLRDLS
jgi:predicted dehydrogenase